jgi:hypothetical protein
VKLDSYARYALMGALAISLACARNTEDMDDTTATGDVTTTDTGATVRVKPDTAAMDTLGMPPSDTVRPTMGEDSAAGAGAPVRPGTTDSARIGVEPDTTSPGPGWPSDTSGGGWTTPPDSGR